jgi:integrase
MDIRERIEKANDRLKIAAVRIRIEQRGNLLSLVGTLPPRPGVERRKPYQQRIALGVGVSAAGVSLAEKEARKVGALLDCKQFDWTPYLSPKHQKPETIGDWVSRYECEKRAAVSEITWRTDYADVFSRLDSKQPLTLETLEKAILSLTKGDSRTRLRFCDTLGRLARFAELDGDFKALRGDYSATSIDPRSLPSDELIAEWFHKIRNPAWRWVYGMIATFGLRNHEAFFLRCDELINGGESVEVVEGKTNRKNKTRQVWAYYPEWIEEFNLRSPLLPDVTGQQHSDFGDRVTQYLRRDAELPFLPYDLRHAWAVRTILFGLPDTIAARQMGHSVAVHTQTYHAAITAKTHQALHETVKNRSDRPVAPVRQK